jgi:hypothetical protein
MVPTNIVEDQFMFAAVTGVASGQKMKNQIGAKNTRDAMLMAKPYFPSDQRRGGNGGPQSLLQTRLPIVIMYDERIETPPRELIAFIAV